MNTTSEICNAIGRKIIAKSVGVKITAVSNASVDDAFPASWFDVVEKLCIEKGIECPRSLFNFKTSSEPATACTPCIGNEVSHG